MAIGHLPAIGTEYGPCADPCEHQDCAQGRADLESLCRFCDRPIGTEGFFRDDTTTVAFVHAACFMKEDM